MKNNPLVSPAELRDLLDAGDAVAVDCRFELTDPDKGRDDWLQGHIPGAHYADMDKDLASPITPETGRHPLPDTGAFARFLSSIGWTEAKQLVAYDAVNSMYAGRLWWLMRFFGYEARILDGGLAAWRSAGFPLEQGEVRPVNSAVPALNPKIEMIVSANDVVRNLDSEEFQLLDARGPDRFRGENETLDPVAGHIPGACSVPFARNLQPDGRFKPASELRAQFEESTDSAEPGKIVHSCGSGITACHNLLAMEVAGLAGSRLYPGSWSEWIRDPGRPVETG